VYVGYRKNRVLTMLHLNKETHCYTTIGNEGLGQVISTILTGDFWNCNFWVVVNFFPTHSTLLLCYRIVRVTP